MSLRPFICGFSYGKNLIDLDYPVVEAIRSVLPIVDRYIFLVGESTDGTRDLIASIDPKVQVVDSTWPTSQIDGAFFRIEGQRAMDAAAATGAVWGLHQFCDEVYHEDDLPKLRAAAEAYATDGGVKALLMRFQNFVYDYRSVDTWMYHKVSRLYRLDGSLEIYGDGCGPGIAKELLSRPDHGFKPGTRNNFYLDKHHLGGYVRWAKPPHDSGPPTRVFHYAWVMTPENRRKKVEVMARQYWGQLSPEQALAEADRKFKAMATDYRALRNFTGSHPAVMRDRIAKHPPLDPTRNRWRHLAFYRQCLRHGLKL